MHPDDERHDKGPSTARTYTFVTSLWSERLFKLTYRV
jgi:hypothetical protein